MKVFSLVNLNQPFEVVLNDAIRNLRTDGNHELVTISRCRKKCKRKMKADGHDKNGTGQDNGKDSNGSVRELKT